MLLAAILLWLGLAEEVRFAGVIRQGERELVLLEFDRGPACRLVVGETCRGFRLTGRDGDRVRLDGEGGPLELELAAAGGVSGPASVVEVAEPEPESGPVVAAAERGPESGQTPGTRWFARDEVLLRLPTELPRILSGSTVAPRIIGSEAAGLELISFPIDTVLGETGLLPGDVLLSVNGREVRGVESLAVLVQRFQTADQLQLLVDRNGELLPLTLTFQ